MNRPQLLTLIVAVTMAAACVDLPTADAGGSTGPGSGLDPSYDVTALTWNIYEGADLDPLFASRSRDQIPDIAASTWAAIQATDFHERAGAIAVVIGEMWPDMVGLQEVTLIRMQWPGDEGTAHPTPATNVVLDFLPILQRELSGRGMSYQVAVKSENYDVEFPMATDSGLVDIRITDYDVILVDEDLTVLATSSHRFANNLRASVGGASTVFFRGWASADVSLRFDTTSVRFVTTQLETERATDVQAAQASELLDWLRASPRPVVLAGDLNSPADGSGTNTYQKMLDAGLVDLWTVSTNQGANMTGFTCCHAPSLDDSLPLSERVDYVFAGDFRRPIDVQRGYWGAWMLGNAPEDQAPSGKWPSDHAAIVVDIPSPFAGNHGTGW